MFDVYKAVGGPAEGFHPYPGRYVLEWVAEPLLRGSALRGVTSAINSLDAIVDADYISINNNSEETL